METTKPLDENLRRRVIGQEAAIEALVCFFARLVSGLRDSGRPLLSVLLLGPSGVGKTETAKVLAETLFGCDRAMTRINCEEYAHGHEVSKLLGSPPGYAGSDIPPLLSQANIDAPHQRLGKICREMSPHRESLADRMVASPDGEFCSIVLFDEIEKAHPVMWNVLLGILEGGLLRLGDNSTTDFTRSIILMTSNVGSREMARMMEQRTVGFHLETNWADPDAGSIRDTALTAAQSLFPLEFLNRLDEILVYAPLQGPHLRKIFDKFLDEIHERALRQARTPILIKVSREARRLIIDRGTDLRLGARPLRRSMEKELLDPLSRLIASQRLSPGDVVEVELESDHLTFYRTDRSLKTVVARQS